jgi:glutathione S-transferase
MTIQQRGKKDHLERMNHRRGRHAHSIGVLAGLTCPVVGHGPLYRWGLAPPEYKALHPFGTAPVITDGDLVLGESGAIVEYICRRHANGRLIVGPDQPSFISFLYWFHFANGSLIPSTMLDMLAPNVEASNSAPVRAPSRLQRALDMIDDRLGEARFFAGDMFSAADIMMCLTRVLATRDLTPYQNTRGYLQRIIQRPAHQRALAKAEPIFQC